MATDWSIQVKKFAPDADDAIIAGIVRYCGIALTKRDSSLVSFSDPKELERVRTSFLKKKLALTGTDAELDAAIAEVGAELKGARSKQRVTVYYLLAAKFTKLEQFRKAPAKAAAKAPAKASAAKPNAKDTAIAEAPAAKPAAKPKAVGKTAAVTSKSASLASTGKKTGTKTSTKVQALAEPEAAKPPVAKPKASAPKATAAVVTKTSAPAPAAAPAQPLAQPAAAPAAIAVSPAASTVDVETASMRWLVWLLLAVLVALLIWWLVTRASAG